MRSVMGRAASIAIGLLLVAVGTTAFEPEQEPADVLGADDAALSWGPCPELFPAGCQIAVLHGDPSQPNADVLFRVPAHYDLPAHRHTSAERMVLLSGELQLIYDGHEPVTLRRGMYAYGPAQAVHRGRCLSDTPCVLFIAFEAPVDATAVAGGSR